jgi:hypothetical protein
MLFNFVLWNLINVGRQYGISSRLMFWLERSLIFLSNSCKIFKFLFCYFCNRNQSKCWYHSPVVLVNLLVLSLSEVNNSLEIWVHLYSTAYFCQLYLLKSCRIATIETVMFTELMSLFRIYMFFMNFSLSSYESRIFSSAWNLHSYSFVIKNFNAKQYGAQTLYKINEYLVFTLLGSFWLRNKLKRTESPWTL